MDHQHALNLLGYSLSIRQLMHMKLLVATYKLSGKLHLGGVQKLTVDLL